MTAKPVVAPNCELNATPMLDVLLVLLIIFMAITVQGHRSVDVQLPQPCSGTCAGADQVVLEVLPGPAYRLNRKPIARTALVQELQTIFRGQKGGTIEVAGYAGVRYSDVVTAIDVAKSAGVTIVGITPKKTP